MSHEPSQPGKLPPKFQLTAMTMCCITGQALSDEGCWPNKTSAAWQAAFSTMAVRPTFDHVP
jgi:hypothetical protein